MGIITKLECTKRKNGRKNIYLDDEYVCTLDDFSIFKNKIVVGREIAINELQAMLILVNKNIDLAVKSFDERNINLLGDVAELEEKIDEMSRELELKHIERVKLGQCAAQLGSVYLQTISNLERVGDHITNFAFSIKQYNKPVK